MSAVAVSQKSLWQRLYNGETTYDFIGNRKKGFLVSGVLLLITLTALFGRGLNLGLDFKGGVVWEVPSSQTFTTQDAVAVLDANGIAESQAKIQTLTSESGARIRVQVGALPVEEQTKIRTALADKAGVSLDDVSLNSVSSTWGSEITKKAIYALIIFFIALTAYISIRFEWKMAIAAFAAVVHDLVISVGIYAVFQFVVAPATVIAFLTILGFSLYDTIVVFDKVHENGKDSGTRLSYSEIINLSMNQTLMRSLNTTLAAVLPVLSLLVIGAGIMGAVALTDFALALVVGLFIGAYSSIFIATPVLWMLKVADPRNKKLEARRAARSSVDLPEDVLVNAPVSVTAPTTFTHDPRPRKKKRR
jgi:preprotein translocase subunit SecF